MLPVKKKVSLRETQYTLQSTYVDNFSYYEPPKNDNSHSYICNGQYPYKITGKHGPV